MSKKRMWNDDYVRCVLSTMGVSKESISKFLIGNRFHVKLRILSPWFHLHDRKKRERKDHSAYSATEY